jgi:hypothetical protein
MGKVVPYCIPFKPIFYMKFFDQERVSFFDQIQLCSVGILL